MSEKPLHFVIVGPGIMPIPPKGWGAVEILIWDYKLSLEKLGHQVTILNTKDLNKVIQDIRSIQPDIVHIQYDDYFHICEHITNYTKMIGCTSHFGYLEQPSRWGGYSRIFYNGLRQMTYNNVYQFVLSQGIGNVYLSHGISPDKVIVAPNGVNDTLFSYTTSPSHLDRSIYLAQINNRKRQYLFQNIRSLYFAGVYTESPFNTNSQQYLGEWSKETLYASLSHYGNLVLLSDGEADPLVIKEALVCGLGVVISEFSTANIDTSLPFVTVIPENRIRDIEFVESEIIKNREYSTQNRERIREYGLQYSWDSLIKCYVNNVRNITESK